MSALFASLIRSVIPFLSGMIELSGVESKRLFITHFVFQVSGIVISTGAHLSKMTHGVLTFPISSTTLVGVFVIFLNHLYALPIDHRIVFPKAHIHTLSGVTSPLEAISNLAP